MDSCRIAGLGSPRYINDVQFLFLADEKTVRNGTLSGYLQFRIFNNLRKSFVKSFSL